MDREEYLFRRQCCAIGKVCLMTCTVPVGSGKFQQFGAGPDVDPVFRRFPFECTDHGIAAICRAGKISVQSISHPGVKTHGGFGKWGAVAHRKRRGAGSFRRGKSQRLTDLFCRAKIVPGKIRCQRCQIMKIMHGGRVPDLPFDPEKFTDFFRFIGKSAAADFCRTAMTAFRRKQNLFPAFRKHDPVGDRGAADRIGQPQNLHHLFHDPPGAEPAGKMIACIKGDPVPVKTTQIAADLRLTFDQRYRSAGSGKQQGKGQAARPGAADNVGPFPQHLIKSPDHR